MGERLNISLDKGVHRTPTIGEEGQLSECVNMIPKNGQLVPIRIPTERFHYSSDRYSLLYIHENAGYVHYIHAVQQSGDTIAFYWSDGEPTGVLSISDMTELTGFTVSNLDGIYHISHIGNTLIFLLDNGVKMQVFKGSGYKYLNGQIPELDISFGLKTWLESAELSETYLEPLNDGWENTSELQDINDSVVDELNELVRAKRNSMISNAHKDGYWTFPFFVRYALVMKDGTLIHCSAPVLMTPCTDNPLCTAFNKTPVGIAPNVSYLIHVVKAKLRMYLKQSQLNILKEYDEIIDSVAIYASEQFWTYDQEGKITQGRYAYSGDTSSLQPLNYKGGVSFGKFQDIQNVYAALHLGSEPSTIADLLYYRSEDGFTEDYCPLQIGTILLENPKRSAEDINKEIKECGNFYLLKSYTLEELASSEDVWKDITYTSGRISNISSFQRMEDEMEMRDNYISNSGFIYNRRLNVANLSYQVKNPLVLSTLINYINKTGRDNTFEASYSWEQGRINERYGVVTLDETTESPEAWYQKIQVKRDGNKRIARALLSINQIASSGAFYYIAVPVKGADMLWAYNIGFTRKIGLPLTQHELLNVSYYYQGLGEVATTGSHNIPEDDNDYLHSDTLRVSLPENPWVFPSYLEYTVGNGQVIGMAVAIKALSVGQYGQFPLIIFATDGIWTLQVNDDGTYKPATFLSGDVCSNPKSITQTNQAVLFVTKQGLKIVDGSNVVLLSKPIEGVDIPDSTFIPSGTGEIASRWAIVLVNDTIDRRLSLQQCKCLYDYTDELLHIFNNTTKHYCLALDNNEFASEVMEYQEANETEGSEELDVTTWTFDDIFVPITADDIEVYQEGGSAFSAGDRVSLVLKLRWHWELDDGILQTHDDEGVKQPVTQVQLAADISVVDGGDNIIKRFNENLVVSNSEGIDVAEKEFILELTDAELESSGPITIKFTDLRYGAVTLGVTADDEYLKPDMTFLWECRYGEVVQKMGLPSRVITRNPESLFQVGTRVFGYAGYDPEASGRLGYLITRPIAFGDFAKFKTILDIRIYDQIIQKGQAATGDGTWMLLYGSNDERQWFRLHSLHGNSFKFFRLALVTSLGKDDTISGISIEYEERRGTKMR